MPRFKKYRHKIKKRYTGKNSFATFRRSKALPYIQIGSIVLGVAAVVCVIAFVIVPMFNGSTAPTPTPSFAPSFTPPPKQTLTAEDVAALSQVTDIAHRSVNNPCVYLNEIAFSTGEEKKLNPPLKEIAIYDIMTQTTHILSNVDTRFDNLLSPKLNENWVAYLDVNTKGGGAIWAYNRSKEQPFIVREYFYGMPKITLDGDYLAWITQTGPATDKLYLCHLPTNEVTVVQVFNDNPTALSGVHMANGELVYALPEGEAKEGIFNAQIVRMKLTTPTQKSTLTPSMYVFEPKTNGRDIVFLDLNRSPEANLMLCINGDMPQIIDKGVLNYDIGDGFVAYTKDESVYIYFIEDEFKATLNDQKLRGILASVWAKMVVWYDITDGLNVRDVVKVASLGDPLQILPKESTPAQTPNNGENAEGGEGQNGEDEDA